MTESHMAVVQESHIWPHGAGHSSGVIHTPHHYFSQTFPEPLHTQLCLLSPEEDAKKPRKALGSQG